MPCYDSRDADDRRETANRLDLATRVACSVLRTLPLDRLEALPKEVQVWWKAHQEADRRREARERAAREVKRARQRALDKLTPEERKALGVRE